MSQSLAKIYLHIVFSTINRKPLISTLIEDQLYRYISKICLNQGSFVHQMGGTEDHLHILLELSRTLTPSVLIESIKSNSSWWIKSHFPECNDFSWQKGYAVFSVDQSNYDRIKQYILNQKTHHMKRDFKQELLIFLQHAQVNYDERYLWN